MSREGNVKVALVNTNRMKPPIAPIGLEYVAESLTSKGHRAEILDLCFAEDCQRAITDFFQRKAYGLVGVSLRNTDDCAFTSAESFLGEFSALVAEIKNATDAPIFLGGMGFSTMPERVLSLCKADGGIWAGGEFAFPELATRMEQKEDWLDLPNLVRMSGNDFQRNPPLFFDLDRLPPMTRSFLDNGRYFREGGQAGIETKRGCPRDCIYCADPAGKGKNVRTRPTQEIANELENLLRQGIDSVHMCDSEFNIPLWHAEAVCEEVSSQSLAERIRWYAYCAPVPFSIDLALQMARAGCAGINFGVDSGDPKMLTSLGRSHTPKDILTAVDCCRTAGIPVMLDLLIGSPGESRQSIRRTIDLMKRAEPDRVGVAAGVRVYPGTRLFRMMERGDLRGGLTGGNDPSHPLFFMEPKIGPDVFEILDRLIGDDERFFFFDPDNPERNYNYNANQRLVEAIGKGYRGAYWDILRRYKPTDYSS